MSSYDAIVIGAGAIGSATAYYLSKRGLSVLLIEQFELDHRWGSSHGSSRIIRYSYNIADYIKLAAPNYELWQALQDEAGETLLVITGGIDFGHKDDKGLVDTRASMTAMNIAHEVLTPDEANHRFPQFRFTDDMQILYQADSGLLAASACVKAHVRLAQQHGATLQDNEPVQSIDIEADHVTVNTSKGTYSAAKLVVTAGSWAGRLLQPTGLTLPLVPLRCQLNFFDAPDEMHDAANMPIFIFHRNDDLTNAMYGIPSYNGSGLKAGFHTGQPKAHPDEIDYEPDADNVDNVRRSIGDYLPAVKDSALVYSRICLYTETPDTDFIIDQHPAHEHVIIGAGFSGHGFKFSTIIGKILADLTHDGHTPHEIDLFRVSRFGSEV